MAKSAEQENKSDSPRHIFVTGGVVSSLGKGLTASSLGMLLKARGVTVAMQKLDPYINVDPGTMNPSTLGITSVSWTNRSPVARTSPPGRSTRR